MSNGAPANLAYDAYKQEYQLAAERYENIYKAVWQIFSYLSVVAGALLTFGGDHFQQNFLLSLASGVLLFWFFSTYWPLDRYGNRCLDRLEEIEGAINGETGANLAHYSSYKKHTQGRFVFLRRAHFWVCLLAILLGLVFVGNTWKASEAVGHGEPLVYSKAGDRKTITLTVEQLKQLMQPPPNGQTGR